MTGLQRCWVCSHLTVTLKLKDALYLIDIYKGYINTLWQEFYCLFDSTLYKKDIN